jgi:sugar phosphate isomerase/epimerase
MTFGCCTETKNYPAALGLHYDFIEFSAFEIKAMDEECFRQLCRQVASATMPCLRFNDYCKADTPLVGPDVNFCVLEEYAGAVCARGGELGIKSVGIGAPAARMLPADYPRNKADEQMMKFLSMLSEKARHFGISVLMESVHDKTCNYINTVDEAMKIVKAVNLPNLKVVLDFYHMREMNEPYNRICDFREWVEHTHVSGKNSDGTRTYLSNVDTDDCMEIAKNMRACGYDGSISIEAPTENFESEAKLGLAILRKVFFG